VVLEHRQARPGFARPTASSRIQSRARSTSRAAGREDSKPDLAIEIYRKLAVHDEKNRPTWLGEIAWTYRHRAGKVDLAVATYRDLISSDVKNTASYQWQIADTFQQYGRWAGRDHRLSRHGQLPRKLQAHGDVQSQSEEIRGSPHDPRSLLRRP